MMWIGVRSKQMSGIKGDLKVLTKKSTDKKLDKLDNAELDINVLKKGSSFTGDKDDDVITTSGKLLKKM